MLNRFASRVFSAPLFGLPSNRGWFSKVAQLASNAQ